MRNNIANECLNGSQQLYHFEFELKLELKNQLLKRQSFNDDLWTLLEQTQEVVEMPSTPQPREENRTLWAQTVVLHHRKFTFH